MEGDMGLRKDKAGISVQLYDKKNKPDGAPYFGPFTALHSIDRREVVKTSGKMSAEENGEKGSGDWLTLIAVADTKDRLKAILDDTKVKKTTAHTSAASRRVLIELHVGGVRKTFEKRIVIASGPIMNLKPDKAALSVVHVKVLHAKAKMNRSNPLRPEFKGMSPMNNLLV
jgi:hypothetical protein